MQTTHHLTVPITRWEKIVNESGHVVGGRSVPAGTRSGTITLLIDVDALARVLGHRALKNRTRRASMGSGIIVAKAGDVTEAP